MVTKPEKIDLLYIEDDETVSDLMVQYLKMSKYIDFNIVVKNTLKSGIKYLESNYINLDAILLDLILPNSKGVDTFKSVNEKCAHLLPIVIISGFEDIACKCVKLGAQDYLLKPDITPDLLIRSIKYAIERKKVKEQLKIEMYKSKQNEKKFRNLVEVTKANIYEIDFINNKFIYVNDVMCKNLGYTRKELMEIAPKDILTDKGVNEWIRRLESLGKGEYVDSAVEYEVIRKDGKVGWVLITAEFIEDKNGNITGANVIGIDITDKKLIKNALKKKEDEVYAILENKIRDWREEKIIRDNKRDEQLKLINGELFSMNNILETP